MRVHPPRHPGDGFQGIDAGGRRRCVKGSVRDSVAGGKKKMRREDSADPCGVGRGGGLTVTGQLSGLRGVPGHESKLQAHDILVARLMGVNHPSLGSMFASSRIWQFGQSACRVFAPAPAQTGAPKTTQGKLYRAFPSGLDCREAIKPSTGMGQGPGGDRPVTGRRPSSSRQVGIWALSVGLLIVFSGLARWAPSQPVRRFHDLAGTACPSRAA